VDSSERDQIFFLDKNYSIYYAVERYLILLHNRFEVLMKCPIYTTVVLVRNYQGKDRVNHIIKMPQCRLEHNT